MPKKTEKAEEAPKDRSTPGKTRPMAKANKNHGRGLCENTRPESWTLSKLETLTLQQWLFIQAYQGNGRVAAIAAGYTGSDAELDSTAAELLHLPKVQKALIRQIQTSQPGAIADAKEMKAFWTALMRDPDEDIKWRLRASELLGRAMAIFQDKVSIEVPDIDGLIEAGLSKIGATVGELMAGQASKALPDPLSQAIDITQDVVPELCPDDDSVT